MPVWLLVRMSVSLSVCFTVTMSVYQSELSVRMSECHNVRMSQCHNVSQNVCLSVRMSARMSVRMSQCQNISMSEYLNVRMSQCQNVTMSACQNVCLSERQNVWYYFYTRVFFIVINTPTNFKYIKATHQTIKKLWVRLSIKQISIRSTSVKPSNGKSWGEDYVCVSWCICMCVRGEFLCVCGSFSPVLFPLLHCTLSSCFSLSLHSSFPPPFYLFLC